MSEYNHTALVTQSERLWQIISHMTDSEILELRQSDTVIGRAFRELSRMASSDNLKTWKARQEIHRVERNARRAARRKAAK